MEQEAKKEIIEAINEIYGRLEVLEFMLFLTLIEIRERFDGCYLNYEGKKEIASILSIDFEALCGEKIQ